MDESIWSGAAHIAHRELVRGVHEDYIHAGAQIITANTFATAPHVLRSKG
jgi:S-methylmethionine-dependent homocysteine/selenocysteine methylase